MLTGEELVRLLAEGESEGRLECKASLANKHEICQAICAFANDLANRGLPGVVAVGVDDKGRSTGLAITDELLRELADLRSNGHILPFPSMSVEKRSYGDADIAVAVV